MSTKSSSTSKSRSRVLAIGLAGTGKTSLLGAFWQVTLAEDVPGALRLDVVPENSSYLNQIRERWYRADVEHTPVGDQQYLNLDLLSDDGSIHELSIPDLSGDKVRSYLELREWPDEFDEYAKHCSGTLFFLHPNEIAEAVTIEEWLELVDDVVGAEVDDSEVAPPESPRPDTDPDRPWSYDDMPTDLLCVELFEFLLATRPDKADDRYRIAIIVSAWDLVIKDVPKMTPEEWVIQQTPLFHQFLSSKPETLEWRVYGVSALGGDSSNAAELRAALEQSKRIKVIDGKNESNDPSLPIQWLIEK